MQLSEAEWKVMNVVWQRQAASARDVLEALGDDADWAYTTVKTMLARLVEKGALKVQMRANTSVYEPVLTRRQARRSAMRALAQRAFDGAFAPMLHFLMREQNLSPRQRQELLKLLEQQGRAKPDASRSTKEADKP